MIESSPPRFIGGKFNPHRHEGTYTWSHKTEAEVSDPGALEDPGQIPMLDLWAVFLKGFILTGFSL